VAVKLAGRLGNQLFHFAVARTIQGNDGPVQLDSRFLRPEWRGLLKGCLRPEAYREVSNYDLVRLNQAPRMPAGTIRAARALEFALQRLGVNDKYVFKERVGEGFDSRITGVTAPVWLSGVFNDERYFSAAAPAVRAGFASPSVAVRDWVAQCRRGAAGRPIVAVGFRHSADYASLGWALPDSYYRDAVRALPDVPEAYAWAVFGDEREPNVATARSVLGKSVTLFTAHELSPADQLNAMSLFETLIIPNSTFSWWAAWLADFDTGARVIAPKPWVYFDNELIPDRWISIQREGGLIRPPRAS
jgi:hypothetical protein